MAIQAAILMYQEIKLTKRKLRIEQLLTKMMTHKQKSFEKQPKNDLDQEVEPVEKINKKRAPK